MPILAILGQRMLRQVLLLSFVQLQVLRKETFFQTLETPALTDIRLAWKDVGGLPIPVEKIITYPSVCPDVFFERPLQVVARFPEGFEGSLFLSGRRDGKNVATGLYVVQVTWGGATALRPVAVVR